MLDDATMSRMTGHQHTDDACESTRKLTYADFVRFPDDGRRHELIDGEHIVTAAPNFWHQVIIQRMSFEIGRYLEATPLGWVLFAKIDCVFSFFDVVEPDVLVVTKDQREIITKRNLKGAPAIVVEILSPSTARNDRGIKRTLYERNGVREYWIVDAVANSVTVHVLRNRKFARPVVLSAHANDVLATPILPGFELELRHLFRDLT